MPVQLDDQAGLGRAIDELLPEPPALLGLGEPTHGIKAFPLLRNDLLAHLVERGFRSIVLETDFFAASLVDDYVRGGPGELDKVLATGFSHGFGNVPGNRELIEWLRTYNAGRAPQDQVRFHGFDAPTENYSAPSPRRFLAAVADYLPVATPHNLDTLLGDDAAWSTEAAAIDPSLSIGDSENARALRIIADDLAGALRRAAPTLRPADLAGYYLAVANARTAQGLLRYHAAMATPSPDRVATLLSLRTEMMSDNLFAILAQAGGPCLVFAHNVHLQRTQSDMAMGEGSVSWAGTGAMAALVLGDRYVFVATDANPHSVPGTLQGYLSEATTARRALFTAAELRAALPASTTAGEPILRGHLPLKPAELDGADAVIFIADTDGKRHQYW